MRHISPKAVLWGSLIDIFGSFAAGGLVGIGFFIYWTVSGVSPEEQATRMVAMPAEPSYLVPALVAGFGFTALGGYITGRLAPGSKLLNAGLTALPCIALGLASIRSNWSQGTPAWFLVASYIGVIPVAVLGGAVAARRPASSAPEPPPPTPLFRR